MAEVPTTPYDAADRPQLSIWEKMLWRWVRALRDDVLIELHARLLSELAKRGVR
jgi:hypothetical protein